MKYLKVFPQNSARVHMSNWVATYKRKAVFKSHTCLLLIASSATISQVEDCFADLLLTHKGTNSQKKKIWSFAKTTGKTVATLSRKRDSPEELAMLCTSLVIHKQQKPHVLFSVHFNLSRSSEQHTKSLPSPL